MNLRLHNEEGDRAEKEMLPYFWQMNSGVVCTSRTPASSKRSDNKNCIQNGSDAATSQSWKETQAAYRAHWPVMIVLECVRQLLEVDQGESSISDAEFMCEELRGDDYFVSVVESFAADYGSPVDRTRAWWPALHKLFGSHSAVNAFLRSLLVAFKLPSRVSMEDVIVRDLGELKEISTSVGCPTLLGSGPRISTKGVKDNPDWKHDHMRLYEQFGLSWPLTVQTAARAGLVQDGLLVREFELAFFISQVWPLEREDAMTFVDINTDSKRLLAGCIEEVPDETIDAYTASVVKSPWRVVPGALIGSTKLLLRYSQKGKQIVRAAEAIEYFKAIGWFCDGFLLLGLLLQLVYRIPGFLYCIC